MAEGIIPASSPAKKNEKLRPDPYNASFAQPRAPVAQLDRVVAFEAIGSAFESRQVHQFKALYNEELYGASFFATRLTPTHLPISGCWQ